MNIHASEAALLKHLAQVRAAWTRAATEGIAEPNAAWIDNTEAWAQLSVHLQDPAARSAFTTVVSELLSGTIHSALAALDRDSALANTTVITVRDETGYEFKPFLHEFWPEFNDAAA